MSRNLLLAFLLFGTHISYGDESPATAAEAQQLRLLNVLDAEAGIDTEQEFESLESALKKVCHLTKANGQESEPDPVRLRILLKALVAIESRIDTSSDPVANMPNMYVQPPVESGVRISGAAADAIRDPVLRSQYVSDIDRNNKLILRSGREAKLRRLRLVILRKRLFVDFTTFVANERRAEFDKVLHEAVHDNKLSAKIVDELEQLAEMYDVSPEGVIRRKVDS